jgi:hypothetical protein
MQYLEAISIIYYIIPVLSRCALSFRCYLNVVLYHPDTISRLSMMLVPPPIGAPLIAPPSRRLDAGLLVRWPAGPLAWRTNATCSAAILAAGRWPTGTFALEGERSPWRSGGRQGRRRYRRLAARDGGATSGWTLACWSGGLEGERSPWRGGGRQEGTRERGAAEREWPRPARSSGPSRRGAALQVTRRACQRLMCGGTYDAIY